jgi:hypothetical protein
MQSGTGERNGTGSWRPSGPIEAEAFRRFVNESDRDPLEVPLLEALTTYLFQPLRPRSDGR